jgi:hypothetical protein
MYACIVVRGSGGTAIRRRRAAPTFFLMYVGCLRRRQVHKFFLMYAGGVPQVHKLFLIYAKAYAGASSQSLVYAGLIRGKQHHPGYGTNPNVNVRNTLRSRHPPGWRNGFVRCKPIENKNTGTALFF